ncbi:ABC transporter permease [Novosphingobium sp. FGD1]|uniref:ABC transporter permease n=1 Tax=Novosphingobium silvae TaxID=2692619 RepID=A0A7X4K5C1_9SPHN|nr:MULTISPECIES: ABC transporter permease [Sphingomonadaceae]MDR6787326.1 putative ABC transport system permease protein [Sphingomonas sp. BE138]MYL96771.1 ABC transporter permease [Novosphingobium silvae]
MNLAIKDIRFNLARFALTALGIGFLLMGAIGAIGLYRGIVADALLVIDHIGADLWVVQGERVGPFAEGSSISSTMDRRVEGVEGIASVRRFVQFSQQFSFAGKVRRATITGLDYPRDDGAWFELKAGRHLEASHFEAIADDSVGLPLGATIRLAKDDYRIVGLTHGLVDSAGDGLLFVSINDATAIASRRPSEQVLLARETSGNAAPQGDGASPSSVPQDSKIAAVLVGLAPGADVARIKAAILAWGDTNVLSSAEQRDLLLNQRLWRLRLQILAFASVLLLVTAIVISLIIYMLTMEKLHQIALLKLLGARNSAIVAMILQQAGLIGLFGFGLAMLLSHLTFPNFPRRIVMLPQDLGIFFAILCVICLVASWFGIAQALKVRAQEVLS